jgi:hypothetical protein
MSVPIQDTKKLWALKSDEFNAWRATNDLPLLYAFFLSKLPKFKEWLDAFGIDEQMFCWTVPTGVMFLGEGEQKLMDVPIGKHTFYTSHHLSDTYYIWEGTGENIGGKVSKKFVPYIFWVKELLNTNQPFLADKNNNTYLANFTYNMWTVDFSDQTSSRAHLFQEFQVLKLGEIKLGMYVDISGRNLDFSDLDNLQITGAHHGNRITLINYASCRGIRFIDAEAFAINFRNCTGTSRDEIQIVNSELQRILLTALLSMSRFKILDYSMFLLSPVKLGSISIDAICKISNMCLLVPQWRSAQKKITEDCVLRIKALETAMKRLGFIFSSGSVSDAHVGRLNKTT